MAGKGQIKHIIITLLFLGFILLPFADLLFEFDQSKILENRFLAQMPSAPKNFNTFFAWPQAFNDFYKDNFGLRNFFLVTYNLVMAQFPGTIPGDLVLVGKNRWFYGKDTDYYRNVRLFSEKELDTIRDNLLWRQQKLRQFGIEYVYVVVPRKATLYPENLPDNLNRVHNKTLVDQIVDHVTKEPRINLLDLRPVFAGNDLADMYYPSDLHWGDKGALLATETIINHLSDRFPRLNMFNEDRLIKEKTVMPGIEWVENLGLQGFYHYQRLLIKLQGPQFRKTQTLRIRNHENGLVTYENRRADLPGIVIFTDSFGDKLHRFMPEVFGKTVFCRNSFNLRRVLTAEVDVAATILFEGNIIREAFTRNFDIDRFAFKKTGRNVEQIVPANASWLSFDVRTSLRPKQQYHMNAFVDGAPAGSWPVNARLKTIRIDLENLPNVNKQRTLLLESDYPKVPMSNFFGHQIPFSLKLTSFGARNLRVDLQLNDIDQNLKRGYTLFHLSENGALKERFEFAFKAVSSEAGFISTLESLSKQKGYLILISKGENQAFLNNKVVRALKSFASSARADIDKAHVHVLIYDLSGNKLIVERFGRNRVDMATPDLRNEAELIITNPQIGR
jgi:alginate O-acetyltransferase complex protein AlgJ